MTTLILPIVLVIIGLAVLALSADQFVDGASIFATKLGVPPLLIGMFLIGFGTSAPELVVSLFAALDGASSLALGNAYGSNISNIGLILGVTTLIAAVTVDRTILTRELPILFGVTLIAVAQLLDGEISRLDGVILLALITAIMGRQIWRQIRLKKDDSDIPDLGVDLPDADEVTAVPTWLALLKLVGGMTLLVISSRVIVKESVIIATYFGISDLIIGLTIVAIGTSLPELASTVAAARRGESDLAVGNIIGSNFFNTLAVVGLAAVVHPFEVPQDVLYRDVPVMLLFTVSIWILTLGDHKIGRKRGLLLLAGYIAYTVYLIFTMSKQIEVVLP